MTAAQKLALVMDENDSLGDETQHMGVREADANLMFQMRTSIAMAKAEKRIRALENMLNRVNNRLALALNLPPCSGEETELS